MQIAVQQGVEWQYIASDEEASANDSCTVEKRILDSLRGFMWVHKASDCGI